MSGDKKAKEEKKEKDKSHYSDDALDAIAVKAEKSDEKAIAQTVYALGDPNVPEHLLEAEKEEASEEAINTEDSDGAGGESDAGGEEGEGAETEGEEDSGGSDVDEATGAGEEGDSDAGDGGEAEGREDKKEELEEPEDNVERSALGRRQVKLENDVSQLVGLVNNLAELIKTGAKKDVGEAVDIDEGDDDEPIMTRKELKAAFKRMRQEEAAEEAEQRKSYSDNYLKHMDTFNDDNAEAIKELMVKDSDINVIRTGDPVRDAETNYRLATAKFYKNITAKKEEKSKEKKEEKPKVDFNKNKGKEHLATGGVGATKNDRKSGPKPVKLSGDAAELLEDMKEKGFKIKGNYVT